MLGIVDLFFLIVYCCIVAPYLISAYHWIKYFMKMDSAETKKNLPLACAMAGLSVALGAIWCIIGGAANIGNYSYQYGGLA